MGRERELAAVRARLLDPAVRLLTLAGRRGQDPSGPGGGAGPGRGGRFGDGVWFTGLAPLAARVTAMFTNRNARCGSVRWRFSTAGVRIELNHLYRLSPG